MTRPSARWPAAARAIVVIACLGLLVALAGCGGASSPAASSSGPPSAADTAKAERLLEQTFGANPKASSGIVNGTIDVTVKGVPRYRQPISLSMSGPFDSDAGGGPGAKLSLGASLRGTEYGADLTLADNDAVIGLGSSSYLVPTSISTPIRRPLANSGNALGAVLDVFGIAPRRWITKPRIVGDEQLAGEDVIHGTADIDARRFFIDAARFAKVLTRLRVTDITGLPKAVGPRLRAALVRSVTSATGDLYTGAQDHVMRRARLTMLLKPSAADRKLLGGISSMKIAAGLDISQVGSPQHISAPAKRGSYSALQLTIDALAQFARKQAREGK